MRLTIDLLELGDLDISNIEDPRERLKAIRERGMRARKANQASSSFDTQVEQAIEQFVTAKFDPELEIKTQQKRKGLDWKELDIDWSRIKQNDTLYISKYFDLAEWWKSIGKHNHMLISIAVPSILSLPASNGHQDRTFSTCTHFNDKLRQRLRDDRFEMSVLIAANKSMTSIKVPTETEAKAIIAEAVKKVEASAVIDVCEEQETNEHDTNVGEQEESEIDYEETNYFSLYDVTNENYHEVGLAQAGCVTPCKLFS
jgi:hypothetical protein